MNSIDVSEREAQLKAQCQVYQPLGPAQTRLLRVHSSANPQSQILCDLFTVDLKKSGATVAGSSVKARYEALSYTWGDHPQPSSMIQVNGLPFWVSANLFEGLQELRHLGQDRVLWIDAVCINQKDLSEKSAQVGLMFSIYLKAHRVVVWLGLPTGNDAELFALFNAHGTKGSNRKAFFDAKAARKAASELIKIKLWFRRTWIRQEVQAAREVHIACGCHECTFDQFMYVMEELLPDLDIFRPHQDPQEQALRTKQTYVLFKFDCNYRQYRGEVYRQVWFTMIMRSSLYEATLPQDKVFAVLGIIAEMTKKEGDETIGFPEIDYSKTVSLVYQDFLKHSINVSEDLACLQIFHNRSTTAKDLPSWAIDLRQNITRLRIQLGVFHFCASWARPPRQIYSEHGLLQLEGRRIGVIHSTACPWESGLHREYNSSFLAYQCNGVGLESCISSDKWMPKNQGNKGIEELYKILEERCLYVWVGLEPKGFVLEGYNSFRHQCYAFVSHLVRAGDIMIHASGSDLPFILRPEAHGRFMFLGPALVIMGMIRI
ncbi:heterokaryon incompatibility protein-domain-containing protein [Bisporella sp. PMI_857]|nr:heterokaryon incompatibility protein-domain-containing protein [Bisporella sp. PMI_857]